MDFAPWPHGNEQILGCTLAVAAAGPRAPNKGWPWTLFTAERPMRTAPNLQRESSAEMGLHGFAPPSLFLASPLIFVVFGHPFSLTGGADKKQTVFRYHTKSCFAPHLQVLITVSQRVEPLGC